MAATDGDMTGRTPRGRDTSTPDTTDRDDLDPADDSEGDVPGLSRWQRLGYSVADRLQSADLRRWWDALIEPAQPAPPDLTPFDTDDDTPPDPFPDGVMPPPAWPSIDEDDLRYPAIDEDDPRWPASDPDPAPPPVEGPETFPAVDPDDEDPGNAPPPPSPPDRDEYRSSHMTSSDTARGTIGPAAPETYYDESTPGSRREKLLDGARAAALDAQKESEGAAELRRQARAIEHIKSLRDEYESLTAEARKQETNAENRLTIAAQFREAADKQPAPAA